jgi:DNA anti-recombination protein RmuC
MEAFNQAQKQFSEQVEKALDTIQKRVIVLGKKTAQLQLKCFDAFGEDYKGIERCQQNSSKNLEQFHNYLSNEMNVLQNSIQSCITLCETKLAPSSINLNDPSAKQKFEQEMSTCAVQCIKNAEPNVADIVKRASDKIGDLNKSW